LPSPSSARAARSFTAAIQAFLKPLEDGARPFVRAGGKRDALTLVRAQKFAATREQLVEIDRQREYVGKDSFVAVRSRFLDGIPTSDWRLEKRRSR
jgi:hypothetical protein